VSLVEDLSKEPCRRLTSRDGCIGKHPEPPEAQCDPCKARLELGLSTESPRYCERCGERIVRATLSEEREKVVFFDAEGRDRCAQPPRHSTRRYYDEYPKVGR
jgi:hypothetical protein